MRVILYAALASFILLFLYDYNVTKTELKEANKALSSLESTLQLSRVIESGRIEWKQEVGRIKEEVIERITPHRQELREIANEAIRQNDGSDALNPNVIRVLQNYNAERTE